MLSAFLVVLCTGFRAEDLTSAVDRLTEKQPRPGGQTGNPRQDRPSRRPSALALCPHCTRGVVSCVLVCLLPRAVLLLPDDDFPVVGAGREYIAIHGVGPGHLPHGTFMAARREVRGCSNGQKRNPGHSASHYFRQK